MEVEPDARIRLISPSSRCLSIARACMLAFNFSIVSSYLARSFAIPSWRVRKAIISSCGQSDRFRQEASE